MVMKFKPVPHTEKLIKKWMKDPQFRKEYELKETEYKLLDEFIRARQKLNLTQEDVAKRMKTKASAVARLESALVNQKHSPSIMTLRKYAEAVGKRLEIHLV